MTDTAPDRVTLDRLRTPTHLHQLHVGDVWAFNDGGMLLRATVHALVDGDGPQVIITLPDGQGSASVRPSRLVAPWSEASAYQAAVDRWDALVGSPISRAAGSATHLVFDAIPELTAAAHDWSFGGAVTTVYDTQALSDATGITVDQLRGAPYAVDEGGVLHVPWSMTVEIAARLAERNTGAVRAAIHRSEVACAELINAYEAERRRTSTLGADALRRDVAAYARTFDDFREAHAVVIRLIGEPEHAPAFEVERLRSSLIKADALLRTSLAALTTDMQEWEMRDLIELLRERVGQ